MTETKTLKQLREEQGLKQWELAMKAGVSPRLLSKAENGEKIGSLYAHKIANALGVKLDDINGLKVE